MNNPIIPLIIVHARENNDKGGQINRIRIPSRRLNTFTTNIFKVAKIYENRQPNYIFYN